MTKELIFPNAPVGVGAGMRGLLDAFVAASRRIVSHVSFADAPSRRTVQHARQAEIIRRQAEELAHYRKIIDRSSAQAKIGVWECDLADNSLTWTAGTYDLFELPHGTPITREQIKALYDPDSCREMEALRTKAITERGGLTLPARIKTATGKARWMRLTASVECENGVPIRIFGLKQDVTEEKALLERLRVQAECDPLTGLANRGVVQTRLGGLARGETDRVGALLLLDLDGFKQVNDTYGHAAGDECLREVGRRLQRVFAGDEFVARMGGDEFAVVVGTSVDCRRLAEQVRRAIAHIREPIGWMARELRIGASVGIAFPDVDADDMSQLIVDADMALYAAKADGRNRSRVFTQDLRRAARMDGRASETPAAHSRRNVARV